MANPQVELQITGHGNIVIELDADKAPKSAENFLAYVKKGHYDGTIFHRIIDGFMIQGGGFAPGMSQKPTDPPINNEANNGLKNTNTPWRWHARKIRTQRARSSSSTWLTTVFSTTLRPAFKAGAMLCLAKSSLALKLSTSLAKSKPAAKAFTMTCPSKMW